jgi:hypothetical protein
MTIFINGREKRVLRPTMIDGVPEDAYILANADPIWLHQEGLWHLMPENCELIDLKDSAIAPISHGKPPNDEIPF